MHRNMYLRTSFILFKHTRDALAKTVKLINPTRVGISGKERKACWQLNNSHSKLLLLLLLKSEMAAS